MAKFSTEQLPELLSFYYKRLFPYGPYYRWLSYGSVDPETFSNREMSFTLAGDIYVRYQSFDKLDEFEQELQRKCPEKIDIGAIYNHKPKLKRITTNFDVVEKELVFDIDISDYDSVRTCCKEANVCNNCWKLMSIACKILDAALRDDFGFQHILWVFSGRRGIHCWVCDETARKLQSKVRSDVAEYLQLLTREDINGKIAHIPVEKVHPSIRRAINIIEKEFIPVCVEGQNMLGTLEGMKKLLNMMEEPLRIEVESAWEKLQTSVDRWEAFKEIFNKLQAQGKLSRRSKHLADEIMLQYAYPRLDINVTKGSNHLLKSPFCIHPKTGKVCIPFNPALAFSFNPDVVPVWIMRQAGRYLPEFRELRSKYDFFTICQTPALACEATLQPIRRFDDLDAAIIFSDILVIPQALGMIVEMKPAVGPVLPNPLVKPDDIKTLKYPVNIKETLGYVMDAITLTREKLEGKVPLIGFSGAPWTLMCYMIEGGGSKTMSKSKLWLYQYPTKSQELLNIITDAVCDYLVEQAKAGAQLLQVFESSAEYLGPELFNQYALPCITKICTYVKEKLKQENLEVPMTIFAKGAHYALEELASSGYDVIGIDWTIDPAYARKLVGPKITLQGNLDPCALYARPSDLIEHTCKMLNKFGKLRYIANLGHGIYPDMEPDNVKTFLKEVHTR